MLKKLLSGLLILLMVLPGFARAESAAAGNEIVGVWYLESLQAEAYDFKPVLLTEGDLALTSLQILTLGEDGSGAVADLLSESACAWSENGGEYEIVLREKAYKARLENGKLYIDGMKDPHCPVRSMRYTFVFGRSLGYAAVPPAQNAQAEEELCGAYTGAYLLQGGKVRKLTESIGISISEGRIDIVLETETLSLGTSFTGEAIALDLRDAQNSYAAWLLAGYTNIRIRPCEKRGGVIAADALSDEGELGFRIYFVSDTRSGTEREAAPTAGAVSALDAAFEADALRLAKYEPPVPTKEDVLCDIPDGSYERIGLSAQDIRSQAEAISDFSGMLIGSVAPGGKTGLAALGKTFFAYCDGIYRLLYPSPDHGAEDVYGNLHSLLTGRRGHIPAEGAVYSPDGHYAVIPNTNDALIKARYNVDPILIDLKTGEVRLIETYSNKVFDDSSGTMVAACFSSDSRTLYYTVFGHINAQLYRYGIEEDQTELILRTPDYMYNTPFGTYWAFPGLALTPEGSFALISDSARKDNPQQLVLLKTEDEIVFTVEPHSIPNIGDRMLSLTAYSYSRDSDSALLYLKNNIVRTAEIPTLIDESLPEALRGVILPDMLAAAKPDEGLAGLNFLWAIRADPIQAVKLNTEELQSSAGENAPDLNNCFRIHEAEQSPDGRYALVLVSRNAEYSLLMLRLSDMALRTVEGIDASAILFDGRAKDYPAVIDWHADTLAILTRSGLQLYRFE